MAKVLVEALESEVKYYISNRIDPYTTKMAINRIAPNRVFNRNHDNFESGYWFDDDLPIEELFTLCADNNWEISTDNYTPTPALATSRQVEYIIDLGGEVFPGLTIQEASALIEELLEDDSED